MAGVVAARLKERYEKEIRPELMKELGYSNVFAVPKIEKIVVNMGLGRLLREKKILDSAASELAAVTGQKPVVTKARRSVAGFKIRAGMSMGLKVTLRSRMMYEFLDRLITIAMPRIRDFRGISPKSFDGNGNFAMGIKEHYIFPEINYDKVEHLLGMDVVITTSAATDDEARALLAKFGIPFRK